jgi:hypothetical protein
MWSPRWNDIDRGKPKDSEKNLSPCHFVHHKFHWIDPGANPDRRGERPATNRLSHGTAARFIFKPTNVCKNVCVFHVQVNPQILAAFLNPFHVTAY